MNKNDVLRILDIAGLVSVVLATLLVLIFEFTGTSVLVRYAIAFYVAGFAISTIFFSMKTYDLFKKKTDDATAKNIEANETNNAELSNYAEDINSTRKQKVATIVKLVLSALALVFTAIVLFLY